MPKNTILRLMNFLRTAARKPVIFEIKSAREARPPSTRARPGKLNSGLSQCERTCGHGNSVSVSQCGPGGTKRHVSTF